MCFIFYSFSAGVIIVHIGAFQGRNLEIIHVTSSSHFSRDSFVGPTNIYWVLLVLGMAPGDGFGAVTQTDIASILTELAF